MCIRDRKRPVVSGLLGAWILSIVALNPSGVPLEPATWSHVSVPLGAWMRRRHCRVRSCTETTSSYRSRSPVTIPLLLPVWGPLLRGSASVSYTHLRAHETVLDLVCRLL